MVRQLQEKLQAKGLTWERTKEKLKAEKKYSPHRVPITQETLRAEKKYSHHRVLTTQETSSQVNQKRSPLVLRRLPVFLVNTTCLILSQACETRVKNLLGL